MNMQSGVPRLRSSEIEQAISDLSCVASDIKKLVIVTQLSNGSIAFVRAASDEDEDSVLSFIGMLDFAKMGFFEGCQNLNNAPKNEIIGDVSWIDDTGVEQ